MTEERCPVSLHNVHAYAVKDSVDYSAFANTREPGMEQNVYSILPNDDDYARSRLHLIDHIFGASITLILLFARQFY